DMTINFAYDFNGNGIAENNEYQNESTPCPLYIGPAPSNRLGNFTDANTPKKDIQVPYKVSIYPNPSKQGLVTIKIEGSTPQKIEYKILDVNGKIIFENQNAQTQESVDFSGYNSGVYIIKTTINGGVTTKKIIIK
ncbi:MAG: hypothetical protein COB15_12990, partial [Flavobacteriales bacterium]